MYWYVWQQKCHLCTKSDNLFRGNLNEFLAIWILLVSLFSSFGSQACSLVGGSGVFHQ